MSDKKFELQVKIPYDTRKMVAKTIILKHYFAYDLPEDVSELELVDGAGDLCYPQK